MHQAAGRQCRLEHRQGWGNPHAAADQDQGFVTRGQGEFARRREKLQVVAHLQVIVQVIGHLATDLALDADTVLPALGQGRQRVVAAMLFTVDV
ncbi:hypothetical protein D3C76_1434450 [compost metagenome]